MAEWSIASVLKTEVRRRTGGSNPSLSAKKIKKSLSSPHYEEIPLFLSLSYILHLSFVHYFYSLHHLIHLFLRLGPQQLYP